MAKTIKYPKGTVIKADEKPPQFNVSWIEKRIKQKNDKIVIIKNK